MSHLAMQPNSTSLDLHSTQGAMVLTNAYEQMLDSLASLPEAEAAESLRKALLKGSHAITFMRPGDSQYFEHVHHYFGCQKDRPCDHNRHPGPQSWEEMFLIPTTQILKRCISLREEIEMCHAIIALIVSKYSDMIRERWLKKSTKQKKALLLEAWPNLPTNHRPDIDKCIMKACPHQRSFQSLACYAFPYLNLEDLLHPRSLLILLYARAGSQPHQFAASDLELAPMIKIRSEILPPTRYTMRITNHNYGKYVKWNTVSAAKRSITSGDTVHPVHGHQILIIQAMLLEFLQKCISQLLPEKNTESLCFCHPPTTIPALGDDYDKYSSLNTIAREAQYRLPSKMDLGPLQALLYGRRDAAEDHIWALREDPDYFAQAVQEHRDHRREVLLGNSCGRVHTNDTNVWARSLRSVITDAYVDLFVWDEIHRRISQLQRFALLHAGARDLSDEFFNLLVDTWFFLKATELDVLNQLHITWPASPEIRQYFALDCDGQDKDHAPLILRKHHNKDFDHVLKLFDYLWDPPMRDALKTHTLVGAIEHLLQTNKRAASLVSPRVAAQLSQLSIISECLHQLNLFQPWANKVELAVKERQTEQLIAYARKLAKWNRILRTTFNDDLVRLGKPDGKFRYPVQKRRSQQNVETLRSAEAALDAFWNAADGRFMKKAGAMPHGIIADIIKERQLQRTPPWVEPEEHPGSMPPSPPPEYVYKPFSDACHDPSKQITGVFDKLTMRDTTSKEKTHGLANPGLAPNDNPSDSPIRDDQPTFNVDRRTHKVFTALFHSPHAYNVPGEILWVDFLHAMVSTGFAAQKLQGSAWQFTPTSLNVERPIQFHEPHPGNRVPFTWARRFGRRLARAYGWRGDMFRLA